MSIESPSCMSDSLLAMAMAAYLWYELVASVQITVSFLRPQSHCTATLAVQVVRGQLLPL